jgi:hypothetical protein
MDFPQSEALINILAEISRHLGGLCDLVEQQTEVLKEIALEQKRTRHAQKRDDDAR